MLFFQSLCMFVCYVWMESEGGKVITSCLVYVLVIYLLSAVYIPENILTFQKLPCHFRNNWPCAERTSCPVVPFLFFSACTQAATTLRLFPLLLTECQHVHVSNNNNKTVHSGWLRSHFGPEPNNLHYNKLQLVTHSALYTAVDCLNLKLQPMGYLTKTTKFHGIFTQHITNSL